MDKSAPRRPPLAPISQRLDETLRFIEGKVSQPTLAGERTQAKPNAPRLSQKAVSEPGSHPLGLPEASWDPSQLLIDRLPAGYPVLWSIAALQHHHLFGSQLSLGQYVFQPAKGSLTEAPLPVHAGASVPPNASADDAALITVRMGSLATATGSQAICTDGMSDCSAIALLSGYDRATGCFARRTLMHVDGSNTDQLTYPDRCARELQAQFNAFPQSSLMIIATGTVSSPYLADMTLNGNTNFPQVNDPQLYRTLARHCHVVFIPYCKSIRIAPNGALTIWHDYTALHRWTEGARDPFG